jgi:hypothetical protein
LSDKSSDKSLFLQCGSHVFVLKYGSDIIGTGIVGTGIFCYYGCS